MQFGLGFVMKDDWPDASENVTEAAAVTRSVDEFVRVTMDGWVGFEKV